MSVRLAFDTSTALGSVAVSVDGQVLARSFLEEQRRHGAGLVPAIESVLEEGGVDRDELDEVVVGSGPGSFTGVRVAAATAKGLVRGLGVPLRAFSSLASAALAPELGLSRRTVRLVGRALGPEGSDDVLELPTPNELRYVLFDARGGRVYGACYRVEDRVLREEREPHAARIADVLAEDPAPETRFAGDGAHAHRELLESRGFRVLSPPAGVPTADALLLLASLSEDEGRVEEPGRWEPDYLRPWAGGQAS